MRAHLEQFVLASDQCGETVETVTVTEEHPMRSVAVGCPCAVVDDSDGRAGASHAPLVMSSTPATSTRNRTSAGSLLTAESGTPAGRTS